MRNIGAYWFVSEFHLPLFYYSNMICRHSTRIIIGSSLSTGCLIHLAGYHLHHGCTVVICCCITVRCILHLHRLLDETWHHPQWRPWMDAWWRRCKSPRVDMMRLFDDIFLLNVLKVLPDLRWGWLNGDQQRQHLWSSLWCWLSLRSSARWTGRDEWK